MKIDRTFYDNQFYCTPHFGFKSVEINGSVYKSSSYSDRNRWDAWHDIIGCLHNLCDFNSMLDIGCGCGYAIKVAEDLGIKCAYGIDYSSYIINHRWSDNILISDAVSLPFKDNIFDLIISSSTFEHLYEEDIDKVLKEMSRVGNKWVFLNIDGVDGLLYKPYSLSKNAKIDKDNVQEIIKGHVTVQNYTWWLNRLRQYFTISQDVTQVFENNISCFAETSYKFICSL